MSSRPLSVLWLAGLAFEVRDLVRLRVGALLGVRKLVLRLALALLLTAFALEAGVIREVPRGLLRAARHLVQKSHFQCLLLGLTTNESPAQTGAKRFVGCSSGG